MCSRACGHHRLIIASCRRPNHSRARRLSARRPGRPAFLPGALQTGRLRSRKTHVRRGLENDVLQTYRKSGVSRRRRQRYRDRPDNPAATADGPPEMRSAAKDAKSLADDIRQRPPGDRVHLLALLVITAVGYRPRQAAHPIRGVSRSPRCQDTEAAVLCWAWRVLMTAERQVQ